MMESLYFESPAECLNYTGTAKDKGIVLFASDKIIRELSNSVTDQVVMCSTAGEYTKKGFKEGVISGFSYDPEIAEIVEIMHPAITSVHKLKSAYQKVRGNKNAFMFLLCDGLSADEESIMSTLFFMEDSFKVIGGSAGDYLQFKETLIYIGNKRVNAAAIFFDYKKRTQLIKENLYQPTGTRLLVTDGDAVKRIVNSFDDMPATTRYAQAIGVSESDLGNAFSEYPLGRIIKGNIYIASPMKINPDKSITFYSQLLPNTFVEVLQIQNIEEKFAETIHSMEFHPSFILSVHCILRSLKFKKDHIWPSLDASLLQACPNQAGFITYGEQYFKRHLNQTMVLLLVE